VLLQLLSNERFKSIEHRVVANRAGPRVSVACFFTPMFYPSRIIKGPLKELLSADNPPVFRETSVQDLIAYYYEGGLDGNSALAHFKLPEQHLK
jgi:isopenicillin N synthase-like dioxygenase